MMTISSIFEKASHDVSTTAVAVAAVASPAWLPELERASEIAALLLPIIGAVWLLVQTVVFLYKFYRGR